MSYNRDPKLTNMHTTCEAMGLAISEGKCYYASGAGPATSCKSIWASLVSNNAGTRAPEWYGPHQTFNFNGDKGVKTVWSSLPDSHYKHFCSISPNPNIILLMEPKTSGKSMQEAVPFRLARMDEVFHRFYLWTKMHIDVPVLEEWIPFIWKDIGEFHPRAIQQMNVFGDCVGGWKIQPDAGWPAYITTKLKRGQLSF